MQKLKQRLIVIKIVRINNSRYIPCNSGSSQPYLSIPGQFKTTLTSPNVSMLLAFLNSSIASSPFCEIDELAQNVIKIIKTRTKIRMYYCESLAISICSPAFTLIAGNVYSWPSVPPPLLATPKP